MTSFTSKPLPFALNVSAIIEAINHSQQGSVAKKLINPICLNGLQHEQSSDRYQNSLRQLRLENASSTMLRQLAKTLQSPTLITDPQNVQGGFLVRDLALTEHPLIDLKPACCIDFVIAPTISINNIVLESGDGLLRRYDHQFSNALFPQGAIYRSVFYLPVPILTEAEIAALNQ